MKHVVNHENKRGREGATSPSRPSVSLPVLMWGCLRGESLEEGHHHTSGLREWVREVSFSKGRKLLCLQIELHRDCIGRVWGRDVVMCPLRRNAV